jgi:integrase
MQRFADALVKKGTQPRPYVERLKSVFAHAVKLKLWPGPNPVTDAMVIPAKQRSKRVKYLTREQRDALLQHLQAKDDLLYLFAVLCVYTGLRKSEAIHLRWEGFERRIVDGREEWTLRVESHEPNRAEGVDAWLSKTPNSERMVGIPDALVAVLKDLKQDKGYVLGNGMRRKSVENHIGKYFRPLCDECGFTWCSPHTLRHTFASLLLTDGKPIFNVSKWLGHTSLAFTSDVYGHLVSEGHEHLRDL